MDSTSGLKQLFENNELARIDFENLDLGCIAKKLKKSGDAYEQTLTTYVFAKDIVLGGMIVTGIPNSP
jgi:hypothetical protein